MSSILKIILVVHSTNLPNLNAGHLEICPRCESDMAKNKFLFTDTIGVSRLKANQPLKNSFLWYLTEGRIGET